MENFKTFLESEEQKDVRQMMSKLPQKYQDLLSGFKFRFTPKNTLKNDNENIETLLQDEKWVSKHAQTGESWEQARTRLRHEAKTGKFTLAPTP